MNRDLIGELERNIRDLRGRVEFDVYDFSPAQQNEMLAALGRIQNVVDEVKSKG